MKFDTRTLRVFTLLKTYSYSATEIYSALKDDFDVDRKTFERDALKLVREGWVLVDEETRPKVFYINPNFKRDINLKFTDSELQILTIALDTLKQLAPKAISDIGTGILNTVSESLPDDIARSLNLYKDKFFNCYTTVGHSLAENSEDILEAFRALRELKRISCVYNDKQRELSPTIVKMAAGEPYLFAKDHGDDKIKCFKLGRMLEVEVLDTPKELDDGIEIADWKYHFGGYGGPDTETYEYRIIGNDHVGRVFSEKSIAPDQVVTELANGTFEVKFTQTSSYEITAYLASFGGFLDEIHPKKVRDQVVEIWKTGLNKFN
ncbi:MAG: WYL domain-containing protein [Bacteriovoracaceae bacterium]|nr:WYL domain-containing protein [Bacteriovoracaceae bacterium]